MKTHSTILLIILSAMPIVSCSYDGKKKAPEEARPVDVAVAFTDSVVLHKTYPGYLSADGKATVVGQVNGKLLTKNFEPGSYVRKGQVLFTIDPTLYRDEVARSEAALSSAISSRDYAKSHYEAVKKALEADAVSKMEVLNAESTLQQAESNIKNCKAALNMARTNLGYCTVTAPISGYISDAKIKVGNVISGSVQPVALADIYDNTELSAVFEIEDSQYETMVASMNGEDGNLYKAIPLKFRDALPHSYTADLSYESPSVNQSTGTILLKGKVKNIDNELKDGMYATVSLPYGTNPKAVIVKDAALSTDQLGKYLYVVNDSDKVVYTPVTVGPLYRDSLRVIEKGIKAGDRYVTEALMTVRNGMKVKQVLK